MGQNRYGNRAWVLPYFAVLATSSGSLDCAQSQAFQSPVSQAEASPKPESENKHERIFGIVPAYTMTDARNAPPLKSSEKFKLFYQASLDPFPIGAYAVQAGISQAANTHSGYGQGAAGYGKRFVPSLMEPLLGSLEPMFSPPFFVRTHATSAKDKEQVGPGLGTTSRSFVTRSDSGGTQPNLSNLLGKLAGGALSNAYYPENDRGAELTFSRVAISLGYQTFGNLAIEFWPEIRRKVFRAQSKNQGGKKS